MGIDGEGLGRAPHRYTYLAAVGEDGSTWDAADPAGLSTIRCLDTILSIPQNALIIGFSLGYDHTHWLKDLPDRALYRLLHEETRAKRIGGKRIYKAVRWEGYRLNYMNGRLSVQKGRDRRIVWDSFRFYQAAFTTALQQWGIASKTDLDSIQRMKDARGTFTGAQDASVQAYCRDECKLLTRLIRALLVAHTDAGLLLRDYYGAGSSSSAMLRVMRIKRAIRPEPTQASNAVRCAFFGGRFENSHVGAVPGPVYSYDISSAYPYQTAQLPCLLHGVWHHYKGDTPAHRREIARSDAALVSWTLDPKHAQELKAWAPWPVRRKDGTIVYPASAVGGWIWRDEWLSGLKLAPWAGLREAWVYNTGCDCKPFAKIVDYYSERLKLGKDGKGLAIKLAINGCYGKLAQTKGDNPPFQSFVWAGIITSHTRAMLLDAIVGTTENGAVLMLATDGIFSRVPLALPQPIDTGTGPTKPLGGWESKVYNDGVFIARPGIYWPQGTNDVKDVKARGLGKVLIRAKRPEIIAAFESGAPELTIDGLTRFNAIRDCVSFAPKKGEYKRSALYGEWTLQAQRVTFGAEPKRAGVGFGGALLLHQYHGEESAPYSKMVETKALKTEGLIEQEKVSG